MTKSVKRLFQQFAPTNYKLSVDIDEQNMTFTGKVTISGQIKGRPCKRLTFHQKGLKITKAQIIHIDKKGIKNEIPVDRVNVHKNYDEVRLHSPHVIYPGKAEVTLEFSGKIGDQMHGLYPCYYEEGGQTKKLIATQFESHYAREVFPCIDEPEAKATFDLTLTTQKDHCVISNTASLKTRTLGNRQTNTFDTTPVMSTYLLAWTSGELEYLEAKTKGDIVVRTYATKEHVKSTKFALDFAVKTLDYFEEYFGVKFPLKKCDLVGLPDFANGAMENWGLITFREECFYVTKETSLQTKQYVAMVVAHELAHQWFGNLVTMRWWTDLWLNEGFASWVEFLAVDKEFPQWKTWDQFLTDEQQRALKLDALDNTHPVEVSINDPEEIRTVFDTISYSKGASVIHMLNSYLGAEKFQEGLQNYLAKHSYQNTDTIDLWSALEETTKMPVISFMSRWTGQSGFPVLIVNDGSISQTRFFIDPNHKPDNNVWPVPLGINSEILETQSKTTEKNEIYNADRSGFYRVVYQQSALDNVLSQLDNLPEITKMGIISDMSEASKAGYSKTVDTFKIIDNLSGEQNYNVWESMVGFTASVKNGMKNIAIDELIKPFKIKLSAAMYKELGWVYYEDDTHFQKMLRTLIIGVNCGADNPHAIEKCLSIYRSYIDKGTAIEPDIKSVILATVARLGDDKTFKELSKLHNSSSSSEEKHILSASLTNFTGPQQISDALSMIRSKHVRKQDIGHWLAYSFSNIHAFDLTWQWLKDNWAWFETDMKENPSFGRMPMYVANHISSDKLRDDYVKFFEAHKSTTTQRAYAQGLELINAKIAWRDRDEENVVSYLKNYQ